MATITVVIPTYNQSKYLEKCLNSIFDQTRKPDEVIVVDDYSQDNTLKILKSYEKKIKILRHTQNLGPVHTFNDGLKKAASDYILMVSGDDWLEKNLLEKEEVILDNNPQIAMVYSQSYSSEDGKRQLIIHPLAGVKNYIGRINDFEKLFIKGNFIPYLTVLIRKKIYRKLGYWDERLPYLHDYEMWLRTTQKFPIAYIAEPLATYRIHNNNLHKSSQNYYEQEFTTIMSKYSKSLNCKLKQKVQYQFYINLCLIEIQRRNLYRSLIFFLKSIKTNPSALISINTIKSLYSILINLISKSEKENSKQIKLVLGCGPLPMHPMHYQWIDNTWILTDLYPASDKVLKIDARKISYPNNSIDSLYASHVLEHISHRETINTLKEWFRVLKKGGSLIINVPDLEWACEQFLISYRKKTFINEAYKNYKDLLLVFFGHQDAPGEFHQTGFTQKSLVDLLKGAGFKKISVKKTIDEHQIGVLIAEVMK